MNDVGLVYRHYDQQRLDRECNPSLIIPNADHYLEIYAERSRLTRERHPDFTVAAYGADPMQTLDVFPAQGARLQPVHIFVHGGGWRMLSRQDSSFVVDGLRESGAAIVVLSYRLMPAVTLDEVVADVYSAARWVAGNAISFGGDPNRIFVSGHSAGAHLCGMMVQEQGKSLPADLIKGAILASGNYELEPIRLSARNKLLSLDLQSVARNSPTRLLPPTNTRVSIVWGAQESGQYKEQARDLSAAWKAHGVCCDEHEIPQLNHLEVPLSLSDPKSTLSKLAQDQMAS